MKPVIARNTLNKKDYAQMQGILLHMSEDGEGLELLKRLNLDGFALANEKQYRSVSLMMRHAGEP